MQPPSGPLRSDLLAGRCVLLVGARMDLDALGGVVERWDDPGGLDGAQAELLTRDLLARVGRLDAVVIDLAGVFGVGTAEGLAAAMDTAWVITGALAKAALIEAGGGTIVLIAPAGDAGTFAHAAQAATENLARTLSVEWARFDIRAVAICPRAGASNDDVTALSAWLCSDSGTYVSGTRLEPGNLAG